MKRPPGSSGREETGDESEVSRPEEAGRGWTRKILALVVPPKRQKNRPTVSGWLLILVAIGIGVAAYNTASNILFLVLSFVFALLIVNGVLSVLNFRRLGWELRLPAECRAGETLSGTIALTNRKRWHATRAVWFVVRVDGGDRRRAFLRERIDPGETFLLPFAVDLESRGRKRIRVEGPESTYPFGFLRKQTGAFVEREFLVWPAADPRAPRPPEPRRTVRTGGVRRRVGAGTDLVQLREYQKGDPPRNIHWKATARTGKLMVRQLADEGTGSFRLLVDCAETLWPTEDLFERFLSRVSAVAGILFTRDQLTGYSFTGDEFRAVRHLADLKELNDRLALATPTPDRSSLAMPPGSWIRFLPTAEGGVRMERTG